MTVFLGNSGRILLTRKGTDRPWYTTVDPADVRADINRFSVDFAHEQFITGDRLEITTTGGEDLNWINDSAADNSITRFAHIDQAGGIRLYETFSQAIIGSADDCVDLVTPPVKQDCKIEVVGNEDPQCLADVTSFQITTNRETINTTHLGAQYKKQYEAGLIQGQGQIECFWTQPENCACANAQSFEDIEFTAYLARLCLRLIHGAAFHGFFFIYAGSGDVTAGQRSVWYECETCIVTNVAVTVTPTELVKATVDFVTSGPITLREGYLPGFIELEENEFDIALEQIPGGNIELENAD